MPYILNVVKAQLRRDKLGNITKYTDRDCFRPPRKQEFTKGLIQMNRKSTTEEPVWKLLLRKLEVELASRQGTTTTTEAPVWKLLLSKLKQRQDDIIAPPIPVPSKILVTTTTSAPATQPYTKVQAPTTMDVTRKYIITQTPPRRGSWFVGMGKATVKAKIAVKAADLSTKLVNISSTTTPVLSTTSEIQTESHTRTDVNTTVNRVASYDTSTTNTTQTAAATTTHETSTLSDTNSPPITSTETTTVGNISTTSRQSTQTIAFSTDKPAAVTTSSISQPTTFPTAATPSTSISTTDASQTSTGSANNTSATNASTIMATEESISTSKSELTPETTNATSTSSTALSENGTITSDITSVEVTTSFINVTSDSNVSAVTEQPVSLVSSQINEATLTPVVTTVTTDAATTSSTSTSTPVMDVPAIAETNQSISESSPLSNYTADGNMTATRQIRNVSEEFNIIYSRPINDSVNLNVSLNSDIVTDGYNETVYATDESSSNKTTRKTINIEISLSGRMSSPKENVTWSSHLRVPSNSTHSEAVTDSTTIDPWFMNVPERMETDSPKATPIKQDLSKTVLTNLAVITHRMRDIKPVETTPNSVQSTPYIKHQPYYQTSGRVANYANNARKRAQLNDIINRIIRDKNASTQFSLFSRVTKRRNYTTNIKPITTDKNAATPSAPEFSIDAVVSNGKKKSNDISLYSVLLNQTGIAIANKNKVIRSNESYPLASAALPTVSFLTKDLPTTSTRKPEQLPIVVTERPTVSSTTASVVIVPSSVQQPPVSAQQSPIFGEFQQGETITVTPLPWWRQTEAPFSIDNLFGFTDPPVENPLWWDGHTTQGFGLNSLFDPVIPTIAPPAYDPLLPLIDSILPNIGLTTQPQLLLNTILKQETRPTSTDNIVVTETKSIGGQQSNPSLNDVYIQTKPAIDTSIRISTATNTTGIPIRLPDILSYPETKMIFRQGSGLSNIAVYSNIQPSGKILNVSVETDSVKTYIGSNGTPISEITTQTTTSSPMQRVSTTEPLSLGQANDKVVEVSTKHLRDSNTVTVPNKMIELPGKVSPAIDTVMGIFGKEQHFIPATVSIADTATLISEAVPETSTDLRTYLDVVNSSVDAFIKDASENGTTNVTSVVIDDAMRTVVLSETIAQYGNETAVMSATQDVIYIELPVTPSDLGYNESVSNDAQNTTHQLLSTDGVTEAQLIEQPTTFENIHNVNATTATVIDVNKVKTESKLINEPPTVQSETSHPLEPLAVTHSPLTSSQTSEMPIPVTVQTASESPIQTSTQSTTTIEPPSTTVKDILQTSTHSLTRITTTTNSISTTVKPITQTSIQSSTRAPSITESLPTTVKPTIQSSTNSSTIAIPITEPSATTITPIIQTTLDSSTTTEPLPPTLKPTIQTRTPSFTRATPTTEPLPPTVKPTIHTTYRPYIVGQMLNWWDRPFKSTTWFTEKGLRRNQEATPKPANKTLIQEENIIHVNDGMNGNAGNVDTFAGLGTTTSWMGAGRVLSTDRIASWWHSVHASVTESPIVPTNIPTTVNIPTTTNVGDLQQCTRRIDTTGTLSFV